MYAVVYYIYNGVVGCECGRVLVELGDVFWYKDKNCILPCPIKMSNEWAGHLPLFWGVLSKIGVNWFYINGYNIKIYIILKRVVGICLLPV